MNSNIRDSLLEWDIIQGGWEKGDPALEPEQRERRDRIMRQAKAVATDLADAIDQAKRNPYLNSDGVRDAICKAQDRARSQIEPIKKIFDAFQKDLKAQRAMPADVAVAAGATEAQEIRSRIAELDPLLIAGIYASAAAEGDLKTVSALSNAPRGVYPKIAAALTPQLREKVAVDLRYKDNEAGRRMLSDTADGETGLGMIVGDLRRHVGDGGDEISDVAAGGDPRPGGLFVEA